jgi:hypothetical protein
MKSMTAGQLTQIYTLAEQQGCDQGKMQFLIESGFMADFLAGNWKNANRTDFRHLGRLAPEDFKLTPTFRTIKLGTGLKTADDFRGALKKNGNRIGDWANDILGKPAFTVASEETEVELVVLTVEELGFKDGATRKDIYDRALERGLALCPAEVGPQLRLQYNDQPSGEWLVVAMEPITGSAGSDGDLRVFGVARDSGDVWLNANYGNPDNFWNADNRFVFVRRNSLISLSTLCWESFVFESDHSIRPASFQSHPFLQREQCTSYHPRTLFPIESSVRL